MMLPIVEADASTAKNLFVPAKGSLADVEEAAGSSVGFSYHDVSPMM